MPATLMVAVRSGRMRESAADYSNLQAIMAKAQKSRKRFVKRFVYISVCLFVNLWATSGEDV